MSSTMRRTTIGTSVWRGLAGAALVLALFGLGFGPSQPATAAPDDGPVALTIQPSTVIYGDEASSNLKLVPKGKPFFDLDGDGNKDFLVSYWTRAFHPTLRHEHLDVIFGRADWPAEVKVSDLDRRLVLQFPDPKDYLTGDPVYKLLTNTDVNGDRKDDLVVEKQTLQRDRLSAYELGVYYGKETWDLFLKVTEDAPDLRILQSDPPANDAEAARKPMPDKLFPGDYNGDGTQDLAIGSCKLKPAAGGPAGALLLYFGPYGEGGTLDLAATSADSIVYSSRGSSACSPMDSDFDGDKIRDLLYTVSESKQQQDFHHGELILGQATWPAEGFVSDLASVQFRHVVASGDLDVKKDFVNDDGASDIAGMGYVYRAPRWTEDVECVWLAGKPFTGALDTTACDIRFPDKWPASNADVDGDGKRDFFFEMDQRGTDPWVWRIGRGPIPQGGEMRITDAPDSGDYILTIPYQSAPISWRMDNVGGATADRDLAILEPEAKHKLPEDGRISLQFGPLIDPNAVPPTAPVPPTSTPRPTPLPLPTVPAAAPEIALGAGNVIYGDEASSNLKLVSKGKPFFDLNGDGKKDFLVSYWTRAFHPTLRHEHLDVVFGRDDWPAEAKVSDLDRRLVLQFPNPSDYLTGDPVYKLLTNSDINGDRKDDLVIEKQTLQRDRLSSYELGVYFGKETWDLFLTATDDTPDLRIVQPDPPSNDAEAQRKPMPDRLYPGDYNGDGTQDLAIGSCKLKQGTGGPPGALLLYFGPYAEGGTLDLASKTADAIIYSSRGTNACAPLDSDYDGDKIRDLLILSSRSRRQQDYNYGLLILGRTDWPATSQVTDLATVEFDHAAADGGVDLAKGFMNDDGASDIVGSARTYRAPRWVDDSQCVWLAGKAFAAKVDTSTCDMRFPQKWPMNANDLNGDGKRDYVFEMDQRGTGPWVWRIALGPVGPSGEMVVTDAPNSGDYVLSIPYQSAPISWRIDEVGGPTGDRDLLVFEPEAKHQLPEDGRITLHFGPVIQGGAVPPTIVPPPTGVPPTAVPPTGVPPTTVPPTAVPPTPEVPTAVPPTTAPPTTDPSAQVCSVARARVPASVLNAATSNPGMTAGWGQRCNPNLGPGPFNPLRSWLTLRNNSLPYHPLFNGLVWKCGCS